MFGLMKPKSCGRKPEQKLSNRLHYCGTCKTLGRLYGQRTRFLLNHDTVFLAELLTSLSGAAVQTGNWAAAYQSKNCLRLPDEDDAPLALQFAATANVLLTEFKLSDKILDSNQRRWRAVKTFLNEPFQLAAEKLTGWRFPLSELWQQEQLQTEREAEVTASGSAQSAENVLEYLAEPTATATAMFFDHGAGLIGREDVRPQMAAIGRLFGKMVYLLDALEDYAEDVRKKEFNALQIAYRVSEPTLPYPLTKQTEGLLIEIRQELITCFRALPIASEQAAVFASRLQSALWDRVSKMTEGVEERKASKTQHSNSCWSSLFDGCADCCCQCSCDACCDGCCCGDCGCDCGS